MWQYNYSDELMHYGKKGMRWGHRTGKKPPIVSNVVRGKLIGGYGNQKYNQARSQNKGIAKSLGIGVGNQIGNLATLGYREAKDSRSITGNKSKPKVGKSIVKSMLLTSYGGVKYDQVRAKNKSRGEAYVKAFASGTLNVLSVGYLQNYDAQNKGEFLNKK